MEKPIYKALEAFKQKYGYDLLGNPTKVPEILLNSAEATTVIEEVIANA